MRFVSVKSLDKKLVVHQIQRCLIHDTLMCISVDAYVTIQLKNGITPLSTAHPNEYAQYQSVMYYSTELSFHILGKFLKAER